MNDSDKEKKTKQPPRMLEVRIQNNEAVTRWENSIINLTPQKLKEVTDNMVAGEIAEAMWMYDEMERRDPHIFSEFELRYDGVRELEWTVSPADPDNAEAVKQADFISENFDRVMDSLTEQLSDAVPKGIALVEVQYVKDGAYLVPYATDLVSPWRLTLQKTEGAKKTISDFPLLKDFTTGKAEEIKPQEKFIYHTRYKKYRDKPVMGLMPTLAWFYLFRNYDLKDWISYIERFGIPMVLGKYDPGAGETDRQDLASAVTTMRNALAAVLPNTTEIEIKETSGAKGGSESIFERLLTVTGQMISKVVIGSPLISNDAEHQTKSATSDHSRLSQKKITADAKAIERTINRQFIKRMIDINFSSPEYPVFEFVTDDEATLEQIKVLHEMGLEISKKALRKMYRIAEPEDEEDTLKKTSAPNPFLNQENNEPADEPANAAATAPRPGTGQALGPKKKRLISMDDIIQGGMDALGAEWDKIKQAISSRAESGDYEEIMNGLPEILQEIREPIQLAVSMAAQASEIAGVLSVDERGELPIAFTDMLYSADPVSPKEAIDAMKKMPISKWVAKALRKKWDARGLQIADLELERVSKWMEELLREAMEEGLSFREFETRLTSYFENHGLIAPNKFHLNVIFENNMNSAYNAGRYHQMTRPEVLAERDIWGYRTAGDDRVRPSHAVMDNIALPADHPLWKTFYPPNGHKCRCRVFSLSKDELDEFGFKELPADWDGTLPDTETGTMIKVQADEGFDHLPDEFELEN